MQPELTVALSLVGLLISLTALYAKWQERPHLRSFIPPPPGKYAQEGGDERCNWRFVHVAVENIAAGSPLNRLAFRTTAYKSRIRLEYRTLGGTNPKFVFEGRWSGNPEPVQRKAVVDIGWETTFDPWYIHMGRFIDVAVGQPEWAALAVKVEGDENCYGFTNKSYEAADHWRLEKYRLPVGTYLVTATILSGEVSSKPTEFLLHNDGPALTDLWLDLPSRQGKQLGQGDRGPKAAVQKPLPQSPEVPSPAPLPADGQPSHEGVEVGRPSDPLDPDDSASLDQGAGRAR